MVILSLAFSTVLSFTGGSESEEKWSGSAHGGGVQISGEYKSEEVNWNAGGPTRPDQTPWTGVDVSYPTQPEKTGILAELEGLTADQMCDQYFGEFSNTGTRYFEGAQLSGPLAEYCLNRTETEQDDAEPAAPVMTMADLGIYIRDNAQVIIASGVLTFEPASGEVVINKDTYFASSATAYTANVTVLNTPLELRFVPTQYVWDLGDGTQFITTTAGGSYPDGDARGQYTSPGTFTPSVRISWNVSIRMSGGGQWYNVPGDAYTVTVGQPLTAVEAEAVLTANR